MRVTRIPLPSFLDAAIYACRTVPHHRGQRDWYEYEEGDRGWPTKQYVGIVVILDRKAERRSHLLDDLVREGSSINDVTRDDLLVALPGRPEERRLEVHPEVDEWGPPENRPIEVDEWILDPQKEWDHVGTPGLLVAGADKAWADRLWQLVNDEVERCDSAEDQERIAHAVDQSASSVCDYLGLTEADIPCLVVFSLGDHRVFVFRYGGDADDPPYQLFKAIAVRRPRNPQHGWLTDAVQGVVQEWALAEGPKPILAPPALAGWDATCYLPRQPGSIEWEPARD
jgi:hypothetical protein